MKIVTAEEMRQVDKRTIEEFGLSGTVLMERAGLSVASKIRELYSPRKIVVVAGSGNNGGDGLVAARDLHNEGGNVSVFLTARPEAFRGDALTQYIAAVRYGVSVHHVGEFLGHHESILSRHTVIVDAILGTGLSKPVAGKLAEVIRLINRSGMRVVSVDIPSGISSDDGQVRGAAVKADCTVTFGLPKRGHYLYPGAECAGKLFVMDIGFPQALLSSEKFTTELLEQKDVVSFIPERRKYSHKGDYGHVLVVAGSRGKTGAALMAAKACLRSGAGLVTIGIPESLADIFQTRVTEEMTLILPDKGDGTLSAKACARILEFTGKKNHVLAIGPGIGVSVETRKLIKDVIRNSGSPVVVDADGINSLSGSREVLERVKAPIMLTPHPGEMARLLEKTVSGKTRLTISDIEKNRIDIALSFAGESKTYLVLKGVPTVVATPSGKAYVNSTGNPGMASGGTGDVLTGMIAGLLSQNMNAVHSCVLGVYMHGLAGDMAASEKGQHSVTAMDLIDKIPSVFLSFRQDDL
jgi:hydroxyethylthiazole kinase-like uncharacterized protein yjeF